MLMQFSLTFWIELVIFSWHLRFLSLQIAHQTQVGTIDHHLFWVLLPPLLIQQLKRSAVCSGITQGSWEMLRTMRHTWTVTLQCRNKWLLVSSFSWQKKHLETIWKPLFLSFSWVRHALLMTNHVKHFTLVGMLPFHICFHGQEFPQSEPLSLSYTVYAQRAYHQSYVSI